MSVRGGTTARTGVPGDRVLEAIESCAIIVVTPEGVIEVVNASARRLNASAGMRLADWLASGGFHILDTKADITPSEVAAMLVRFGSDTPMPGQRLGWMGPQATHHVLEILAAKVDRHIVLTLHDVTAEWALRDRFAADELRGGFPSAIRNVAHNLANVLGTAQIAADALGSNELDDTARRHLDSILDACARGGDLTQTLLVDPNAAGLVHASVDVSAALLDVAKLAERVMPTAIRFTFDIPDEPVFIRGRKAEFDTAAMHILSNGRKAIVTAGIADGELSLYADASETEVRITVEDNGPGFSDQMLANIFDPYFSFPGAMGGRGVGLAFVETFVWRVGGQLSLTNRTRGGTRVILSLPRLQPDPEADASTAPFIPTDTRLNGCRVLLAETDDAFRLVLSDALRSAGCAVAEAANGREAIRHLDHSAPDILVTNFQLSDGMSGAQLVIATQTRHPETGVLYLTGYGDLAAAADHVPDGMVLRKPVRLGEFKNAILRMMASRSKNAKH